LVIVAWVARFSPRSRPSQPDTILALYRKLVARKFSGSQARQRPGRLRLKREVEQLIIRMASENRDWGYDRIAGAMTNLGYVISDQTAEVYATYYSRTTEVSRSTSVVTLSAVAGSGPRPSAKARSAWRAASGIDATERFPSRQRGS
jgi:hypothetical protein